MTVSSNLQRKVCKRYAVAPFPAPEDFKVGIALNAQEGIWPIHGLRLNPAVDTCGWYIWAGEMSDADDFFKPLCVACLEEWCPIVIPYLQLPPGWRFLLAPGHEDVWHDPELELDP